MTDLMPPGCWPRRHLLLISLAATKPLHCLWTLLHCTHICVVCSLKKIIIKKKLEQCICMLCRHQWDTLGAVKKNNWTFLFVSVFLRHWYSRRNSCAWQRLPWEGPETGPVQSRPDYSNLEGEDIHRPGVRDLRDFPDSALRPSHGCAGVSRHHYSGDCGSRRW